MRRAGGGLAVAVVVMVSFVGCQLKKEEPPAPTGPSETSTSSTSPGLSSPVLGSAPTAPSPTPSSDPDAPEPTPSPTSGNPAPTAGSCSLPPSNPASVTCTDESPRLVAEVEAALDAVTERYPELFDFNDTKCETCYFIKDTGRYLDEVIKQLNRQGLCARGGLEEIGVKSTNDFSEQYDIILASDHMRRAPGSYRGVCRPAIF
jgi:hypothetical protein